MASVALFHSVLGVRPGVFAAADALRSHGHTVHVVDQYDGQVFDDYEPASAFMGTLGFPALMERALAGTADMPDGFVTMGFSNGAGMAEYVAGTRPGVAGVIMSGGSIDPAAIGITWPQGLDGQVHTTVDDPWRQQDQIAATVAAAKDAGGRVEVYDYPGSGHLFADPSKADEYQAADAEMMWARVFDFLDRV